MLAIRDRLREILAEENPMTVRQVFYQAVSRGIVTKTENEYKQTVCRLLGIMRRKREIPFRWIADNTRWMRKPRSYSSLTEALELTKRTYRRALWDNQTVYVEVWLEKDALAGVLYEVTSLYDVPLMVTRGYPSLSYLYESAEDLMASRKPAYIYYLGDFDPSGVHIPEVVERDLREYAPEVEIVFERLAVAPEQIVAWNLPTRPTKRTDTRAKNFGDQSVEVDAIPPHQLRQLVREAIERHIDQHALQELKLSEAAERETLQRLVARFSEAQE
ncbi:hypothetical protein [Verrucomicrobium sp. 3C]|uniref:hypothetical protein n=1 Tax=Verrucomicrobium sp. 3C TaxID=1134055 RepID=UPI000382E2C3|nr:hypothetical protein [Verrucomicrobium sp. 3C]